MRKIFLLVSFLIMYFASSANFFSTMGKANMGVGLVGTAWLIAYSYDPTYINLSCYYRAVREWTNDTWSSQVDKNYYTKTYRDLNNYKSWGRLLIPVHIATTIMPLGVWVFGNVLYRWYINS